MAFVLKDRVKESTTSAGTGAISLGGAAATFDTFQSVLTDGATTYYAIVHTASGVDEWEVGLGTWNTGNTLTRTTVLSGSNGTSAVDFSAGVKDIFMTYPATKAVYQNADSSVTLPDGLSVMGIIDGATSLEVETHIDLNTTDLTKPAHREGRIFYDEEYGALAVYNGEADITLQVGQEEWILAYNGTGSSITDGTPVYAIGAVGEAVSIAPADATAEEKARVVGLATHTIEAGTQGYVTVRGLVSNLDTSGLTAGEPIHLSPSGGFQNAAPTYPYYPTDLGYCISSSASNGYVYVQPVLHTYEQFRVTGNQHIDGNLTVDGDLTITGTQSIVSQSSLAVDDSFIYLNSGDTIGVANTAFSGTGLDDATLTGHYNGTTSETYYVRIDGVGTGTGGVDTFEWSLDNFSTTEATGVDCTTTDTDLADGISVRFNATTGHTSGDTWSGDAAPINVDSGTFANRNTGASGVGYTHMGWFFDISANKFVFLEAYDPEPEGTIDLNDASVTYATLKAGAFEGNLTGNVTGDVSGDVSGTLTGNSSGTHTGPVVGNVSGDVTGNADTATALETSRTIQITGDVIGSATFNGTANAVINASVQDDSHAHVISNVDGLQSALDGKTATSRTITAGGGLTGGGDLTANRTISHADTSTQTSLTALTGAAVVSDVDVDTYGHVTNLATRNLTLSDLGYTGETNATADQTITAGSGLTGGGTGNVTISHSDTSSQASVNNSGRTYIQDITLDAFGHITGISSATETVVNTDTNTNQLTTFQVEDGDGNEVTISHGKEWKFTEAGGININWTDTDPGSDADPYDLSFNISTSITAGNGLTGGGVLSSNQTLNVGAGSGITVEADTVSHADTSSQASVNGSGRTYIQDVTLDGFGHVTGLTTATETVTDTTYSAGAGLTLTGTTFSHTDTSAQGSVNNSGATVIQDVTLDTYGHVTGLASVALTPATIGAATAAQGAAAVSAVQPGDNVSIFINDAGYTTNVGDITGVTAGSGLTGGGTSGTVTISHADTSSQASVNNSGAIFVQDITLDTYGHLTGIGTATITPATIGAQAAGQYNTIIGTDSDLNTSGSTIIDNIYVTDGVITSMGTRTLTLADLGYTGATNANYITNNNQLTNGAGYTTYSANQALNTNSNPTFNDIYVADQIIHSGDSDTYTQFHAADNWRVVTGNSQRLGVSNGAVTCSVNLQAPTINITGGYIASNGFTIDSSISGSVYYSNATHNFVGSIIASGDVTAYSDERLKSNVKTIDSALEKVQNLRGVTFDKDGRESLGVIAQEVQKVIPQVVTEGEEYLSVAYGNMVGLLIEAIKEQQEQIEELKGRLK